MEAAPWVDRAVATSQALTAYIRRARETLTQPIYDRNQVVAAATPGTISYFTNIGGKNGLATNQRSDGVLPAPRQFLVRSISVNPDPNATIADVSAIVLGSLIEFWISDKIYLQIPTFAVPGGTGVAGFEATSDPAITQQQANSGWQHPRARFHMAAPGQLIRSQENFRVDLIFPAAIVLGASRDVWIFLHGLELRAVQ